MQHLIKSWARARLQRWLADRQPAANPVRLRHSYMFVLPTRFGVSVLLLLILLYILGTNYQNNLILLLAYALLVLWLSCILLVFLQLHGRDLTGPPTVSCFAGEATTVSLSLTGSQPPGVLLARWWQPQRSWQVVPELTIQLELPTMQRGRYLLPRLALACEHPFGLMRCWVYLQLDSCFWVYPKPQLATTSTTNAVPPNGSNDEWLGLQRWTTGNSMRQINWKRYARDGQLRTHLFGDTATAQELWLTLNPQLGNLETQLSDLTARVLLASQQQVMFGVRLANSELGPARGEQFVRQVLQELALC